MQQNRGLRFVLVDCGRWNSNPSRRSDGAWFGKSLGIARVNGCTDAVWPPPSFDAPAIYRQKRGKQQMHFQAHEPHRFFLCRRRVVTRTADGFREKISSRKGVLGRSASLEICHVTKALWVQGVRRVVGTCRFVIVRAVLGCSTPFFFLSTNHSTVRAPVATACCRQRSEIVNL
ncbi:hypothetical protein AVEN_55774-1 [Araneus ventricosus]|uniref:Uncharacterized protein n=1 Tax=Araneus ventricosus TaxID=182803 RepID=A0A4Y2EZK3_ARAVE|nr:hypothetical protein AVEN_55774-1 [Araneus ventricosus]